MQPVTFAHILNDLYQDGIPIDDLLAAAEHCLTEQHRSTVYILTTLHAFARMCKHDSATVTLSVPSGASMTESAVQTILERHNLSNRPVNIVTDDLIGGYAIEHANTRIDRSYRTALLSWYTHCTT